MGYFEGLITNGAINGLLALGLYWTVRTGQVSVGHAGFLAVGAYLSGFLSTAAGVHWLVATAVGVAASGVLGAIVGTIALRFVGLYLAVATLAFGEIVRVYFLNADQFGSASGLGGMVGTTSTIAVATLAVVVVGGWLFDRSDRGIGLVAVGEDPQVAELMGLPTTVIRVSAFTAGAAITGLGGALYAHHVFFIEPSVAVIGFERSILILMMVVLGGTGSVAGPLVGAAVFTGLPELLRYVGLEGWRMVLYSLLLAVLMTVRPEGLVRRRARRAVAQSRSTRPNTRTSIPGGSRA